MWQIQWTKNLCLTIFNGCHISINGFSFSCLLTIQFWLHHDNVPYNDYDFLLRVAPHGPLLTADNIGCHLTLLCRPTLSTDNVRPCTSADTPPTLLDVGRQVMRFLWVRDKTPRHYPLGRNPLRNNPLRQPPPHDQNALRQTFQRQNRCNNDKTPKTYTTTQNPLSYDKTL